MNVYENMAFALKLRGYSRYDIERRVTDAARILGIKRLLKRKPRELSGGERQRVAVGRAIVRKPLVFLFDEPLSNLDAKMRVQMRTEIHKLHLKIKTTMIYVTHDQVEAMTLGDRIAVMKDGRIQQFDAPSVVYEKPANKFVAGFIGTPPMNFVQGKLVAKEGAIYFDEGHFQLRTMKRMSSELEPHIGKEVYMGVRAENIYDKLFASDATGGNTIRTTCDVVEIMGSHNLLYLSAGKHTFIASVEGYNKPATGTPLEVVFDMDRVHFFDLSTEKTIA
jgi:multiple sugar transport system ATP-binding protein